MESVINAWASMTFQCQAVAVVQRGNVPAVVTQFERTFRSKPVMYRREKKSQSKGTIPNSFQ